MTKPLPRLNIRTVIVVSAALGLLALAGCGTGGGSSDSASSGSSESNSSNDSAAGGSVKAATRSDAIVSDFEAGSGGLTGNDPILTSRALIRTGAIDLQTDDIAGTIDKVQGLALTSGGDVLSENTSTDDNGDIIHSSLQIEVPVATFQQSVDEIAGYSKHVSVKTSTEDVTQQVADVDSRVRSAKASILQLRALYTRATKLGQVIDLERELSQRQANLEALQAQQRSLAAQTTMSTIMIGISKLPPASTTKAADDHAGFVSGIKKGWDAMVTFVVGASHALGLVLPLAILLSAVGLVVWFVVRRFTPRRETPQPSE
jgi:hypothetical protein